VPEAIAQKYKAVSIVLPKMSDMREILQSEIQSTAEQKCPGSLATQQKYAKEYRVSVHRWSYGRLICHWYLNNINLSRRQLNSHDDTNLSATTVNKSL
jgi:hypothetical protein